jgi:hypothetical protein
MSLEYSIRFIQFDTIIVLENLNQIFGIASTFFSRIFGNSKN